MPKRNGGVCFRTSIQFAARLCMTKVLIVEDEQSVGFILRKHIENLRMESVAVDNAFDALKELSRDKFDLVLTDLCMPMMNGVELIDQVHLIDPDLPIIVVTGLNDAATVCRAWRGGAVDYCGKPFQKEELRASIERALALHRERERTRLEQLQIKNLLSEKEQMVRSLFQSGVGSLVAAVEARFPLRAGHSARVAQLAVDIGSQLGCTTSALEKLHTAGMLHDAGVLGSPATELIELETAKQWEQTERILGPLVSDEAILRSIKHRGERFDGLGQPDGLPGGAIPLGSRILAVAIAYDQHLHASSGEAQIASQVICQEIEAMSGTYFDRSIVDALWFAIDDQQSKMDMPAVRIGEIELVSEEEDEREGGFLTA